MSDFIYHVAVTQEGDKWLAEVTNRAGIHTFADSREKLDGMVDEVIRLAEDLPDSQPLVIQWH